MTRVTRKKGHGLLLLAAGLAWSWMGLSFSAETKPAFKAWLSDLREEARSQGISQGTLDLALKEIAPIPRVIELDRSQPEVIWTLEEYLSRVVTEHRITTGRAKLSEHRALWEDVYGRYGVRPELLAAFWAVESDFGRGMGGFPVIGATATLAYDGRRGAYFRKELLLALRIVDEGHISPDKMVGSWAGAMGQFQFMPSTFVSFAVDHDGDGRKDIWDNVEDSIASAANYLSRSGWEKDQTWGWEVSLPEGMNRQLIGLETRRSLSEWKGLGVRLVGGRDLPDGLVWSGSLMSAPRAKDRNFLVSDNYRAIYKWNPSHLFAIAVGTLADRIGGQ
jgi:membrane-bound lytic murein transglycosylase B